MRLQEFGLLAIINLVWGFNVVAVKLGVDTVAPVTAALFRYAIVLVVALPWLRWVEGRMPALIAAGVAQGALWIALVNVSFALADDVAALSLVGQLGAPFSLVLAVIFLGERIRVARSIAIIVSLLGVAVIGWDTDLLGEGLALWLGIAAAIMYSFGSILMRGLAGVHPLTIIAWLAVLSVPLLGAGSALFEPGEIARAGTLPVASLWPIAYSALISSLIGHVGVAYMLQRHAVSTVSPFLIPAPLIGAGFAVAALGEQVTARLVIGGLLIVAGVGVITIRTAMKREAAA